MPPLLQSSVKNATHEYVDGRGDAYNNIVKYSFLYLILINWRERLRTSNNGVTTRHDTNFTTRHWLT